MLKETSMIINKLININMMSREMPNFSVLNSDKSIINYKRFTMYWMLSPHNKN